MKGSILFSLFYVFMTAWAGGYQGCVERVWMYQAYLIDQLNPEADRSIGLQCKKKDWDDANKKCSKWTPMVRSNV